MAAAWDDYRLCVAMGVYVAVEYCRGGINQRLAFVWLPMLQRADRLRRSGLPRCGRSEADEGCYPRTPMRVVDEMLQPEHVSTWLKDAPTRKTQGTAGESTP